jgi:hypothetical protein
MRHDQDYETDDNDIRNAKMIARHPGLVAAFGIPPIPWCGYNELEVK